MSITWCCLSCACGMPRPRERFQEAFFASDIPVWLGMACWVGMGFWLWRTTDLMWIEWFRWLIHSLLVSKWVENHLKQQSQAATATKFQILSKNRIVALVSTCLVWKFWKPMLSDCYVASGWLQISQNKHGAVCRARVACLGRVRGSKRHFSPPIYPCG